MNHWDTIISTLVEGLPDSLSKRDQILEAILAVAPRSHPGFQHVRDLHAALVDHQLAQREFNLTDTPRGGSRLGDTTAERSRRSR